MDQRARYKLVPDPVLGVKGVRGQVLHEASEALVEPEVGPPLHGDEVAEPLVSRLMADDYSNVLLRQEKTGQSDE